MALDAAAYLELARVVAMQTAKLSTSAFYITDDDSLRLRTFGALAGVTLALETRIVGPDGVVQAGGDVHTPNTDRTEKVTIHDVGEGFLLSASLRATAGAPRRGQVFAILDLVRGSTGAIQPLAMLLQGYVTDSSRLGWPGSPVQASADGPGVIRSITGSDPAAAAEILETVPTNARWKLLGFRATLVTDANVANRLPRLVVDDGSAILLRAESINFQVASTTMAHWAAVGLAKIATASQDPQWGFPVGLALPGGFRLGTSTVALQAGDNWSAPQLLVEEWIED